MLDMIVEFALALLAAWLIREEYREWKRERAARFFRGER